MSVASIFLKYRRMYGWVADGRLQCEEAYTRTGEGNGRALVSRRKLPYGILVTDQQLG